MFVSFTLMAQPPATYYNSAAGKSGAELKTALYNIIKSHTELSYSALWTAFRTTDVKPNGRVWDMYSNTDYTFGTDQGASYNAEGQTYNREHSFPKSWFKEGYPMYTDLFHLYPADGYVNSQRSNYPFGNVRNVRYTSRNGSKLGTPTVSNFNESNYVFEPANEYKGDFARTYLYMATRYEDRIASWRGNNAATRDILDGNSFPAYKSFYIDLLIEWHKNDPVSEKEINRNNAVYALQGNRNPYIDHPEWVECVWKGICVDQANVIIANTKYLPTIPDESTPVDVSTTVSIYGDDSIQSVSLFYGTSATIMGSSFTMTLSGDRYIGQIPTYPNGTTVFFQVRVITQKGVTKSGDVQNYRIVEAKPDMLINSLARDPQNPESTDIVKIISDIYVVKDSVVSAKLYWSIAGNSTKNTVNMTANGNEYTATIPAHPDETIIEYYVEVQSQTGIIKVSEKQTYVVRVYVDVEEIVIENINYSPTEPSVNEKITITADVHCNAGSVTAWLRWYDLNNPAYVFTDKMTKLSGDNFTVQISAPSNPTDVCYQILGQFGNVFNESLTRCIDVTAGGSMSLSGNLLKLTEADGIAKIEFYNLAGQLTFSKKYAGDIEETIDVSSFAGGMYVIRIWTVKGTFVTKKVLL